MQQLSTQPVELSRLLESSDVVEYRRELPIEQVARTLQPTLPDS